MKIIILAVYFGKYPDVFPLWLKSCSFNTSFNWVIIGDHEPCCEMPMNVGFRKMSLRQVHDRLNNILGFEAVLTEPYKLCDYKPSYGEIFHDIIGDYDFYGWCDMDMIFGNLSSVLTLDILEKVDRFNTFGHLIILRNNSFIRSLYRDPSEDNPFWTTCQSPYWTGFDEWRGFLQLTNKANLRLHWKIKFADIHPGKRNIVMMDHTLNHSPQTFRWHNGEIHQVFWNDERNMEETRSHLYIHFQKRKMKLLGADFKNTFYITAKGISKGPAQFRTKTELRNFDNKQPLNDYIIQRLKPRWKKLKHACKLLHPPKQGL